MATINHNLRIEFKQNSSFSQREKTLNEELQKNIDLLNSRGYITLSHSVANKNEKFASVNLVLQKMFGA